MKPSDSMSPIAIYDAFASPEALGGLSVEESYEH